jgi:phosphoglycolate phosphatase-like HAD superfamily hydrolase
MIASTIEYDKDIEIKEDRRMGLQQLTLFCDFDGPIVDVSERYYSTYQLALDYTQTFYASQGIKITVKPMIKADFWQMKRDRICDLEIAMRSGLQEAEIPFFMESVEKIVNHPSLLKKDKIHPGVNWALALLHSKGIKLVLVTLRREEQVNQILSNYGLKRLFSGIYGGEELNFAYRNNNDVKIQLLKQAIADHESETAYMIGDTEADILAAQKAGIPAIALTCGIRSQSYLEYFHPDYICQDLLSVIDQIHF